MKRTEGNLGLPLVECLSPKYERYLVRWDMRPTDNGYTATYIEKRFEHKPTIDEIQEAVLAWANTQIDAKILSGFKWREHNVWLSTENQFNYKAAYDLAVQTNGASLPVVFKFGTTKEPTYFQFDNLEDLSSFYFSAMSFINTTLAEGWREKDAIDWSLWEQYL